MRFPVYWLVAVLVSASLATAHQECQENESYMECGTCEKKCSDPPDVMCTMDCKPAGCYCSQEGFRRNATGACVPEAECPNNRSARDTNNDGQKNCAENEVFLDCGTCERNCDEADSVMCTMECKPAGCYCPQNGFRRNAEGTCVAESACPNPRSSRQSLQPTESQNQSCKPNEIFMQCGGCEMACTDPPTKPCTLQCRPPGCYCPVGFRRKADGSCVPQGECAGVGVSRAARQVTGLPQTSPCLTMPCPPNTVCQEKQVQCFVPPCNPIGECVPAGNPGAPGAPGMPSLLPATMMPLPGAQP